MLKASKEEWRRALIASAFCLLTYIWFFVCEDIVTVPTYVIEIPLDDAIPFIPAFIVPYYIWYFYLVIPMVWLFFASPESFTKGMTALGIGMAAACIIYMIAPNGQRLRVTDLGDGFFERWVAFTYSMDSPNNVAPSLHVLDSIAIHSALMSCAKFRKCRPMVALSTAICIACSVSTVFVKQHSIFDVFISLPLAALIWLAVFGEGALKHLLERVQRPRTRV